jgi:hypothetical protein
MATNLSRNPQLIYDGISGLRAEAENRITELKLEIKTA